MNDPKAEAERWRSQAENDVEFARLALDHGYYHQACFVAQQCAEKALKAVHYAHGARGVIGHACVGLLARLVPLPDELADLDDIAAELDLFYIPARYPNGLVEGVPHRVFTRAQAKRALRGAQQILTAAAAVLGHGDA